MAEETARQLVLTIEQLPLVNKPVEEMTLSDLMIETNRHGLVACLDMCKRYDPESDIKERRLIADITGQTMRANLKIAEEQFKAARQDQLGELLAALKEARKG